ncbi:hypothetical protein SDC9_195425 [bioreactor metagenome]|uniref:Uncharacterized protein n=1 Tax=bioreactor metagenome TaxID=1076179 RepID=A0A645I924_9ZZZZ
MQIASRPFPATVECKGKIGDHAVGIEDRDNLIIRDILVDVVNTPVDFVLNGFLK